MRRTHRPLSNVVAVFVTLSMLVVAPTASPAEERALSIPPGYDLFVTDPAETHVYLQIPADFFAPGSDPFNEVVQFAGVPLERFNGFDVGDADTIVRRLDAANPAPSDTVPIELVALSLKSVQPIYVTNGDGCGQLWDVTVGLSPTQASPGQMTIRKSGTFDSQLQVRPFFKFTDLQLGCTQTLDGGSLPPFGFTATDSFFDVFCELPALSVPGLNDGFCAGFDGEKHLTIHSASNAQHGVWPAQNALEHFQCYRIKDKPFDARTVSLTDQFGSRSAEVTKRVEVCNPVRKKKEPFSNRRAHLVCYTTSGPALDIPVTIRNQFGSQQLMVHEPTRLCLPSRKKELGETLKRIQVPIDHFQCYKVSALTPLYRKGDVPPVRLRDQFADVPGVPVGDAVLLCAPVDKNGSKIEHPVAHLVCYQIEAPGIKVGIVIKNQFERTKLVAKLAQRLCVPSAKVVLEN
jgi:hypothetical protein